MLIHHLPRSYLFSLASIRESIRAKSHWAKVRRKVRRKSRLWIWFQTIEAAGQVDAAKVVGQRDLSTVKKSVKDRFKAKKAWKRARMKTKAIQHWTKADECLQNALRDVQEKQRNLELLAEVGL